MTASPPPDALSVLLISPLRGLDPQSGDVTYTESLLRLPPPGVRYTTYQDALEDGSLVEHGRRPSLRSCGRAGAPELGLLLIRQAEKALRRCGAAFREPFRYFSVEPGAFDLVHAHVFSLRLWHQSTPLVMSAAGPLRLPYGDAWGWSGPRVRTAETVDRWLAWMTGVNEFSRCGPQVTTTIAFSEHDRRRLASECRHGARSVCIPNFAEHPPSTHEVRSRPFHVGFIATDFAAKGGQVVLDTWPLIRSRDHSARLTIVGSEPRLSVAEQQAQGISWMGRVERDELRSVHIPDLDVLLYPTQFDGLPYVVLEALAAGVPVVTSDYGAMPEVVAGGAGAVAPQGHPHQFADRVLALLEPGANHTASAAAIRRYRTAYSPESVLPKLAEVYRVAVTSPLPRSTSPVLADVNR